ncbi:hypothetical protein AKJ16_DCAP18721, partial [Drosera capensis]
MHAGFIGRRCVVDDRIGDFCLCCFGSLLGCIYPSCEACVGLVAAGNGERALAAALIPWHHLPMLLAESHVRVLYRIFLTDFLDPFLCCRMLKFVGNVVMLQLNTISKSSLRNGSLLMKCADHSHLL